MKTIKQETYLVLDNFHKEPFEIKVYDGYKIAINIILRYTYKNDITFPFLNRTETMCTEYFLDELMKIKKSESQYFIIFSNTDFENIYKIELCKMYNGLSLDYKIIESYYTTKIEDMLL